METQQNLQGEKSKMSLGFFFLSLGVLITLITTVVSFLNLVFGTLEKRFPDVLNSSYQYGYSTYDYEGIRMSLATLVIFFPVFLIVSYFWKKFMISGLSHEDTLVKKWLIYIVLFLSSLTLVIDLVTLVKYFISGEITTRFLLKVLAVLVVALYVGVYYVFELRNKQKVFGFPIGLAAIIKSSVLVVLIVWFSFSVMGSPVKQRFLRLDDRRVSDLQNIQWQIINHYQQKSKLPEKLTDLTNPLSGYTLPTEPEFEKGKTYEYNVLDAKGLKFELCADFSLDMPKGWREYNNGGGVMPMMDRDIAVSSYPSPIGGTNESWDHKAGKTCFERTIDKDMFPPFEKSVKY
ncbi:MAG: hypothetical protein KBC44_00730 [Candidatus Pacebacteria bacterium]|nr:hypothetical protein [Candidatus Paceibacterota bacterium]MBP9839487.1 hypothetical protein [Candidatus Paceibacterota bacterium]